MRGVKAPGGFEGVRYRPGGLLKRCGLGGGSGHGTEPSGRQRARWNEPGRRERGAKDSAERFGQAESGAAVSSTAVVTSG